MDPPDPRTRTKVSLDPPTVVNRSTLLSHLVLSDVLLVLGLHAGKTYLLSSDVGVFWVLVRVLACGAVGAMLWAVGTGQLRKKKAVEWSVIGTSSLLFFLRQAGLFIALYRLPSTRVIVVTHFSTVWLRSLLSPTSLVKAAAIIIALLISFLSDSGFSVQDAKIISPAYGALVLEAVSSSLLDHTQGVLLPSMGQPMATAASLLGAFVFSLPLYLIRHVLVETPSPPFVTFRALSVIPFLAFVVLYYAPKTSRAAVDPLAPSRFIMSSYPVALIATASTGFLLFRQYPRWTDFIVASLLLYGVNQKLSDPVKGSPYASTSKVVRSYLKSILSNPESRKIFYFLMLNMCYMLVQMLYGVWTNSLGLISDAIHMAFDCMAIGVGLIASVMARWPPNEKFTYGYGRIETLSGFANGIFLILISLFIVFEAIQRLLDPPEMNTSQLLLVSSLGLGVNLFGMFAMGGHHHHGGHSHSHGHAHSHAAVPEIASFGSLSQEPLHDGHSHSLDDAHSHSHAHLHEPSHDEHAESHSHSHSHAHAPTQPIVPAFDPHSHSHDSHSHSHSCDPQSHSHSPEPHSHSHSPEPHSHSHSPEPAQHSHSHEYSHSHAEASPSHTNSSAEQPRPAKHARQRASLYLHLPPADADETAPLTPNYKFGHDSHFETHHSSAHSPNLHDHSHVHAHAHEGHSHNMRGVFLHVLADTLGSVGVILSTLLIQFYGWTGFDPIASLFIAVLIAASVLPLVIDTGKLLALDLDEREHSIRESLNELPLVDGLASYTCPRFWPKDAESVIGSIHVQLAPAPAAAHDPQRRAAYVSVDRVVERVDRLLRSRIPGLEELTIQVEEPSVPD